MRTTLTLDDDVAAALKRLRREKDTTLKQVLNDTLRKGLGEAGQGRRRRKKFRTRVFDTGRCLIPSLDCVSRALALAEGEDFR